FRGSIPHPMQSLCTLRNHCRQWPRNTRYQADAAAYLGRTFTGWIAPACGWRTYSITSSAATCRGQWYDEAERSVRPPPKLDPALTYIGMMASTVVRHDPLPPRPLR